MADESLRSKRTSNSPSPCGPSASADNWNLTDDERRRLRQHVADSIERDGWQYADSIGDINEATDADNYGGEEGW